MTLHILHPSQRLDRLKLLEKQLSDQEITDYKLWDNPIGKTIKECRHLINQGHKKIVRYAKENNLEKIAIAENDLNFLGKDAWKYYLENEPKDYDIYFSMIYAGDIEENRLVSEAAGFTLYIVNKRFYDTFLSITDHNHIDRFVTKLWRDFNFQVCPFFICEQNNTPSDHTKGVRDLKKYLKGRKLFTSYSES